MYRAAVIGDRDSIYGFAALGLEVFPVTDSEMGSKTLRRLAEGEYAVIYITEALAAELEERRGAIQEAEAYHGPSLIIGYAPCEMHSIKGGMQNCQKEMKKAVDCGYWNMFRFNPALKAEGKNPFTLDSKAPTADYKEFIMGEARYSALTRSFPDRAEGLFERSEIESTKRYAHLQRLQALYAPEA